MKKICFTLLLIAGFTATYAQKIVPAIKAGTNFFATAYTQGQEIPVLFNVEKMDATGVTIKWSVDGFGDGAFVMNAKGVENGTSFFAGQPSPGATQLGDNETSQIISKAAFKSLIDTKSFTYSGMKFTVKPTNTPFKIGGKEVDAFHLATDDGAAQVWVLNNPAFPLLLQTNGLGLDISVSEIK